MMPSPFVLMGATLRNESSLTTSPASRRRGRRNALPDVTVGITANQLRTLEAMVQTYVPDGYNPSSPAAAVVGRPRHGSHRRNAVGNVVEGLTHDELHHLEDMVRTYQPDCHRNDDSDDDGDTSSGDGEESCFYPSGPCPAYYERRRNALANPLADLDYATFRRIQNLHNNRQRAAHHDRI